MEKDQGVGLQLHEEAVELRDVHAKFGLGRMYFSGKSVEKDEGRSNEIVHASCRAWTRTCDV